MGPIPLLTTLIAVASVILMFGGMNGLALPIFAVAAVIGCLGFAKPGNENPRNGRVLAGFAIAIAFLPVAKPFIDQLALQRREAIRARETAPLYKAFDTNAAALGQRLDAFASKYGQYPALGESGAALPMFNPDGSRLEINPADVPILPKDPFAPARVVRVAPVGNLGALIISVGQDGVPEMPLPQPVIDAQPNDPLAPFALIGRDVRTLTYDPTNGALGLGDLMAWHGRQGVTRDQAFNRLDDAWRDIDRLTPPPPPDAEYPGIPASEDDALTAMRLLEDKKYLAVVGAASRAVATRRPHPNFWGNEELFSADLNRGLALFQLGHPRAGADLLISYLVNRPNEPIAHYYLGVMLLMGGADAKLAARHFAAGFQLDPNSPIAPRSAAAFEAIERSTMPELPQPAYRTEIEQSRNASQTQQNQSFLGGN
ncbi:hypothetical protein KQI84_11190 [bacterium]|nr:hypothetical protein [bacterium]